MFKSDLYRSFAIGFVLGSAMLFATIGLRSENGVSGQVIPTAQAAPAQVDLTR